MKRFTSKHLIIVLLLATAMIFSLTGCFDDFWDDDYDEPGIGKTEWIDDDDYDDSYYNDGNGNNNDDYDYDDNGANNDNGSAGIDFDEPWVFTLDMSSPDAFIADVKSVYSITLEDRRDFLSGADGLNYMREFDRCLALFSPELINRVVDMYGEYGASFSICLDGTGEEDSSGVAEWDNNSMTIYLNYDPEPINNGLSATTLAHELGHAIHFLIEEEIGEAQSERDMTALNGSFSYVEDDYYSVWNESIHSAVFAYDYSMYDYYEDIATIFEKLVEAPGVMRERLSNPNNELLFLKVQYIRDITYMYISDGCNTLFAPLYDAEEHWFRQQAA